MEGSLGYTAIAVKEDDGRFSAIVPDLAGCAVWGHTLEEAVESVKDAFEVYLTDMIESGERLPQPKHYTREELGKILEGYDKKLNDLLGNIIINGPFSKEKPHIMVQFPLYFKK